MAKGPSGLRTIKRTLDPEAFDPGQPVEYAGERGIVWCLGPEVGPRKDSRWVVCTDGVVRILMLDKGAKVDGGLLTPTAWGYPGAGAWGAFHPTNPVPFTLAEYAGQAPEPVSLFELAA